MSKDTKKNLVGQPVFKQVMKILPREQFDLLVNQSGSDRYYKSFFFVGATHRDAVWDIFTLRLNGRGVRWNAGFGREIKLS